MKPLIKSFALILLLLGLAGTVTACGQKGPLEVERAEPIQEEESGTTK